MMRRSFFLAVVAFALLLPWSVRAEEVIRSFDVVADIHADRTIDITETIAVTAEQVNIRHGIYRDIPLVMKDDKGRIIHVPLHLKDVTLDGKAVDYHTEYSDQSVRYYLGSSDELVSVGPHVYSIHYQVGKNVRFFKDYDEFYWNVTGNAWMFPIELADIRVNFPSGAHIKQYSVYQGYYGSGETADDYADVKGNTFHASASRVLRPGEGLTIAAAIQKGIIQPETPMQHKMDLVREYAAFIVLFATSVMLFVYLLISWLRYGRDDLGTVIPRFDVPVGVEPALLRYVRRQVYDIKCLIAELIDLARQGYITLSEDADGFTIAKANVADMPAKFMAANYLMATSGGIFVIPKKKMFGSNAALKAASDKLMHVRNLHADALKKIAEAYINSNSNIMLKGLAFVVLGGGAGFLLAQPYQYDMYFLAAAFALLPVLLGFWRPMIHWTPQGQQMANYAEGLKLYLSIAEQARMNTLFPKTITPDVFEKMLPYALALGVEQEWCDHFSSLVVSGVVAYSASNASMYGYFNTRGFANMGSSIAALHSSMSSCITSSGSGGGGSSGGGGGGGGGGGW